MNNSEKIFIIAPNIPQVYVAISLIPELRQLHPNYSYEVYTASQHFIHFDSIPYCKLIDRIDHDNAFISPISLAIYIGHSYFLNDELLIKIKKTKLRTIWINAHFEKEDIEKWGEKSKQKHTIANVFTAIIYENEFDTEPLKSIGFKPKQLFRISNIKYDCAKASAQQKRITENVLQYIDASNAKVIVASSVGNDKESQLIIESFQALYRQDKNIKLILAPRNLEHVAFMTEQLIEAQLNYQLHSKIRKQQNTQVILIDQTGVLKGYFHCADIAVMGRSFYDITRGGSNIIEPAAAKLPIITGPFMDSFINVLNDFKKECAILQLSKPQHLTQSLKLLLASPSISKHYGNKAYDVYKSHSGAMQKTVQLVNNIQTKKI